MSEARGGSASAGCADGYLGDMWRRAVRPGLIIAILGASCGGPAAPALPPVAPAAPRPSRAATAVAQASSPAPTPAATAATARAAPAPAPEAARGDRRFPAPFEREPAPIRGRVAWVADGDTLDIELPSGKVRVRLLGVDTPEKETEHTKAEPWGPEVGAIVARRLRGAEVELIADLAKRDAYDRVLGYVHLDGEDVGAWLLAQGYADVFRIADHPRRARYLALQGAARGAKRGLWGGAPAAPAFIGNRRSKLLHAPGCRWLPAEANREPFDSREAATRAGYTPHRECLGGG